MRKGLKWLLGVSALIAACSFMGEGVMWESVSGAFMKDTKPYGPGDFRVRDGRVISMKLAKPVIEFREKTVQELSQPDSKAEVTEPWMDDTDERYNRRTISILKGSVNGPIAPVFHERAQYGDWWLSPDWKTLYVAARWQDGRTTSQAWMLPTQKLWKSTDGGEHWTRLDWPETDNITFLRFLDAQRGYLIGWGPRIWRTEDGGTHWVEIHVPANARNPAEPRQQFDLVALGDDRVLRFAFFSKRHMDMENQSLVYALPWGETTPKLAFTVPQQTVVDLLADAQGNVFVLGWDGLPGDYSLPGESERNRPSVVSHWDGTQLHRRHEFDADITGHALYRTPSGKLLLDGVDDGVLPDDVVAVSPDEGKSWERQDEGSGAQGGYYDAATGVRWRVAGYALSKRTIP